MQAYLGTPYDQAHRVRMVTFKMREFPARSTTEHGEILEAIIDGNDKLTKRLFTAHRERVAKELLGILEKCGLSNL